MFDILLRAFVRDYQNTSSAAVRKSYGTFSGVVGIILNLLLFLLKLAGGVISGAVSVIADAFNNLSDAGSSIITLIGFKLAGKKQDREHPFGHGRVEYIAGLIVSFIIILVGLELLKSSAEKIFHPEEIVFSPITLIILIASIAVKLWMGLFNRSLGRRIGSAALKAVAADSISDVCATAAVLAGLCIAHFTGLALDGYIGIIVALFIIFSGYNAAKETLSPLLGAAPDPELVNNIKHTVCAHDEIIGIHDLIIHDYGPGRFMISLHAEVPDDIGITAAHDVIDLIEMELQSKFNCGCTIHMDPVASDDEFANQLRGQLKDVIKSVDERLTFHDFRYVTGPTHTNLIFDVAAPFDLKLTDSEICEEIKLRLHDINESFFAVIRVDRDYTASL
ncbi:MAG: cation diffusion facilitator family transporter [Acutalibacteraceae bacterium]